jgi:hypothetical protein
MIDFVLNKFALGGGLKLIILGVRDMLNIKLLKLLILFFQIVN